MMIASLANITNRIKLGSMTANLTFSSPAHQASLISTVDNLVKVDYYWELDVDLINVM